MHCTACGHRRFHTYLPFSTVHGNTDRTHGCFGHGRSSTPAAGTTCRVGSSALLEAPLTPMLAWTDLGVACLEPVLGAILSLSEVLEELPTSPSVPQI